MSKFKYTPPALEIIVIEVEEIICASSWEPGDGKPPWAGESGEGRPKYRTEFPIIKQLKDVLTY